MMNVPTQTAVDCQYAPLSKHNAAATVLSDERATTRPNSSAIIPELETYQWQDTYFDDAEYCSSQEIIAVFDHDLKAISNEWHCNLYLKLLAFVFISTFCVAFVAAIAEFDDWDYLWIFLAALWILVGARASFDDSRKLSRIAPPHTAVTRQGVLHVNGGNYEGGGEEKYFLPWNEIVDFSNFFLGLRLVNVLDSYLIEQLEYDSSYRSTFLALGSLKKPYLFQKLALALKSQSDDQSRLSNIRQDELGFEASMMEMVAQTAAASNGSSDQILAAIHEELKRRNDILKSALESESCKTCDAPRIPVAVAYPDGTYS